MSELKLECVRPQLAGIPVEDRLRRTALVKSAVAAAGSGEDGSGGEEAAPKERGSATPTHSLWMLSRKFVRLLLTTQVPPASLQNARSSITFCRSGYSTPAL